MSASQAKALRRLAEPIVLAAACDLEDVVIRQAGNRRLVRVVVDHDEGSLTLDLVAAISRDIARVLDESTVLGQAPYVLEVTSPGVDRPLRSPRHWHRAIGRIVLVLPRTGASIEGRVITADDVHAVLEVDGHPTTVEYADVVRAVVQVEFTRIDEELEGEGGDDDADHADAEADAEAAGRSTDPQEG